MFNSKYFTSLKKLHPDREKYYDYLTCKIDEHDSEIKSILEIGCGDGHLVELLQRKYPDKEFQGIDIHGLEMNHVNYQKVNILNSDEFNNFFKSGNTFDFIICMMVLEHISDVFLFIKNINNLLRVGGYLYLSVPNVFNIMMPDSENFFGDYTHIRPFTKKGITRLLTDCSFSINEISSGQKVMKRICGIPFDFTRAMFTFKSKYLLKMIGRIVNAGPIKVVAIKIGRVAE